MNLIEAIIILMYKCIYVHLQTWNLKREAHCLQTCKALNRSESQCHVQFSRTKTLIISISLVVVVVAGGNTSHVM